MASDTTILVEIKGDGTGARVIKRDLDDIEKKSERTRRGVNLLKTAFVGLAGALSARAFSRFADSITTLETRLKNVSDSTAQANERFNELFTVSQRTGDSITGLAQSYSSLSVVLSDSVRESTDLVRVTELLSRGFAASGANATTAAGATLQLTQGLATNFKAAGQELNSIIEGAPILAKAIAEQLGGESAADLKIFAEQGRITSKIFLEALVNAGDAIEAFEIPPTISRSVQRISNEFIRMGKESEALKGISGGLATALDGLANNLGTVLRVAGIIAGATLPLLIRQLAITLPLAINATTAALSTLTLVISANPIGAIAVAISAAISAFFLFRKEIFEALRDVDIFGVGVTDIFFAIKNTAIEIFAGLVDIVTLPFRIIINEFQANITRLKQIANSIPGVNFQISDTAVAAAQGGVINRIGGEISETASRLAQGGANIRQRTLIDIGEFESAGQDAGIISGGNLATPPIVENIETATGAIGDLTNAVEDELTGAFDDLGDTITDSFENGFSSAKNFLSDFVGNISSQFQSLLSGISNVVIKNIGGAVLGGTTLGTSLGFESGDGGGFSAINSGIGKLLSDNLDQIGGLFGVESLSQSSTLTNGSFGGSIGGAAGGFAGNFLANSLFGDRGVGASIGGTVGSIAGSFIPVPILGTAIGGFIGNAIGGLFGGSKPSDKRQITGINLETLEQRQNGFTGSKFSQENRDFTDAVINDVASLAQLLQDAGATLSGSINVSAGNRTGLISNGQEFGFNSEALVAGVNQQLIDSITGASANLTTALGNVDIGSTQDIAEAIGLVQLIDSFEVVAEATSPLMDALDILDAQFNELETSAASLGLPTEKLAENYELQRQALIDEVVSPLQDFLDNQALSDTSSLTDIDRLSLARSEFDQNISAITEGDLSDIDSVTGQASALLSVGRDVFASGEGFAALESFVRQSVSGVAESLGAEGGLDDSIAREITLSNAAQTSAIEQMALEIRQLAEENAELRKAMERVGNSLVAT